MRHLATVLVALLLAAPAVAGEGLTLDGRFSQGGLVRGTVPPGSTVVFEGRAVRVSPEGAFLIGFSRDAPPEAVLEVTYPDGRAETRRLEVAKRSYDIQRIDGLPPKMVTPPAETLDRIRREAAAIAEARARDLAETLFESGWIWPARGRISGVYGSQRVLNGEPRRPHYGIDIAAPVGTPVVAPADAVIALVHRDMYYTGGTIILDHGHGLTSAMLHLHTVEVEPGQRVKQGERIGTIGRSGRATGPHLDWRINLFDARLDPAFLVPPMVAAGSEPVSPASGGAARTTAPDTPGSTPRDSR